MYLDDENISTTSTVTKSKGQLSSVSSSNTYVFNRERIGNVRSPKMNVEDRKLADYMAYLAISKHNSRQLYTSPFLEQIEKYFLQYPSLPTEPYNLEINITNSSIIDFVNNLITRLEPIYIFSNPTEIIKYLNENKHLIYFLLDANQKIQEIFNKEKLELKIICDPEIENWRKLIINIHTQLDADEAFDKLKTLDDIWWLDVSPLVGNDLDINIDFDEI